MSDGLRFIRFSVASPAGENRLGCCTLLHSPPGHFYPAPHTVSRGKHWYRSSSSKDVC